MGFIRLGEEAYHLVCTGKVDGDGGSGALLGEEGEGAAVVFDDAADDEEAETVALFLGGAEGLVHGAHDLVRDAGSCIADDDTDFRVRVGGGDKDASALTGDGLVGVADEVVEGLKSWSPSAESSGCFSSSSVWMAMPRGQFPA